MYKITENKYNESHIVLFLIHSFASFVLYICLLKYQVLYLNLLVYYLLHNKINSYLKLLHHNTM